MIDERIEDIDFDLLESKILEAAEYIKYDDYESSEEIIKELLNEYENIYKEDENERYFCFDSPVMFYIYDMKFNPKKVLKPSKIDYRTLYFSLAEINLAYEDYENAEENLKKALYWNPVDSNLFFTLAKLFVRTNELSKLKIVLQAVRPYILDRISYAKYYAYLGEYFKLKEDYKTALSLFYVSQSLYETKIAEKGCSYILDEKKCSINAPTTEEIIEILKKDDFNYSLDLDVLGMIYDLSYEMQKNANLKGAIYCLDILYDLTQNEKYKREREYLE